MDFYSSALKMGLEGIMAKRNDSIYQPGERSKDWLKIKANKRHEVVIGGFTNNEGSDKPFSSLLVGVFKNGELHYTGKIGTGFNIETQKEILAKARKLKSRTNPFSTLPDINKPSRFRPDPPKAKATWLKPELVCEVSYTEITEDGIMRHPSFESLRIDKNPEDVTEETGIDTEKLVSERSKLEKKNIIRVSGEKERKTLLNPKDERQVREIGGHELAFTNLSKIFWPEKKITKRDMLNYYYQIAPYILPYLKDHPQILNRHPNGIRGKSFYQKDVKGKVPGWIDTFSYYSETDKREKEFMVITDEASLLYMASLACIEMHPWHSRKQTPDRPDWCIIDLDPDKNSFNQVIKAAQITRDILDSIEVPSYCKTSGSTGLHIYIPLAAKYTYEQSKEFARAIAKKLHSEIPEFTTIERYIENRQGKMYIDFLQNRPQATVAAPYSLRPRPGATVSMPLHWDEVKPGLGIKDFNIYNAVERAKSQEDIFRPVLGKGIDLQKALNKLNKLRISPDV
jgi:bifunctional non-homologous end joining protein LigD